MVHARPDRTDADAEHFGDIRVAHALDVVKHQRGPIVRRQRLDIARHGVSQLALELRRFDPSRPVIHRLEVTAGVDRGQHAIDRDRFGLLPSRQHPAVRRASREPVEPRGEGRIGLERADRANGRHQRGLRRLFGVVGRAGEMAGQAIDALAIAFHEPVAGVRVTPEQRLDETGVDICVHPRATSLVSRRHRAAIDMLTTTLAWPCPRAETPGGARCETPGLRWAPTSESPAHATGTRSGWRVTWRRSTLPRMRSRPGRPAPVYLWLSTGSPK